MVECKCCIEGICVNADCPVRADYCSAEDNPILCGYYQEDCATEKGGAE